MPHRDGNNNINDFEIANQSPEHLSFRDAHGLDFIYRQVES